MKEIKLDIYSFIVEIKNLPESLALKLANDFEYFLSDKTISTRDKLVIEYFYEKGEAHLPQGLVASGQSENSITYNQGNFRYNDYYGEALTIFDYEREKCRVYSTDINFSHEIIYLIVLSRSGKYMDRNNLHKVHAFGVSKNNKNLIMMMPSKGGKTTHFCKLLSDEKLGVISDDTPVISNSGRVVPFPLRVGLDSFEKLQDYFPYITENDVVSFKRKKFSKKYLLNLKKIKNKISVGEKNILIVGKRSSFERPNLQKVNNLKMVKYLLEHMVVGIGLPMIVEYFLRNTVKDHLINFGIFMSRLGAAIKLSFKSDKYVMVCSSNIDENTNVLRNLLDER